jgi:alkanesulfonate monooxygenase SsuD/methylene tetrahydromethanopterin reductase-like flavin-dependent oxidoreductase (luciferase family)
MKIDAFGAGQTISGITRTAQLAERAGFDGLWIPEGGAPVFSLASAAASEVKDMALGSGVAVAFARSPMVTAQAAWMLAEHTGGNFLLGLGTQVRAHVERRYSADFAPPGPRMREYVQALREIFAAFARRSKLSFQGDYYTFTLLPETWTPRPIAYSDPPVYLAGVHVSGSKVKV